MSRQLSASPIHVENGGNGDSNGRLHFLAMIHFSMIKLMHKKLSEAVFILRNYREKGF